MISAMTSSTTLRVLEKGALKTGMPSLAAARQVVRDSTAINLEQPKDAAVWNSAYERFEKLCRR